MRSYKTRNIASMDQKLISKRHSQCARVIRAGSSRKKTALDWNSDADLVVLFNMVNPMEFVEEKENLLNKVETCIDLLEETVEKNPRKTTNAVKFQLQGIKFDVLVGVAAPNPTNDRDTAKLQRELLFPLMKRSARLSQQFSSSLTGH